MTIINTKEGFKPVPLILKEASDEERLQISKKIMVDHFKYCSESEADEAIFEMKPFLKLDEYRILKKFNNEERKGKIKEEIKDLDEIDVSAEMRESATRRAKEIMKSGNPIKFINDVVKQYHIGDHWTEEGLCVSIASQSCLNSSGIQISSNGESGSGKSHLMKVHIRLVPAQYRVSSALSPKAAYYMNLKEGMIVFSDDVNMSIEMEEIIKRATTNYQEKTEYNTVYNGAGKKLVIPPRINWFLTSVNSEASKEVLNRQLTFSTIETPKHKNSIFENQRDCAIKGIYEFTEITEDILVCRAIYEMIKSQTFKVKIPFAKQIELKDKSDSRIYPLFLDMIKGYAVFFYKQRQLEDNFLIAEKEDFDKAMKLFTSQLDNIITKLNDKETKILKIIAEHPNCTINQIADCTKISYNTVRHILKGRPDRNKSGLLDKVTGLCYLRTSENGISCEIFSLKSKLTLGKDKAFITLLPEI